MKICLLYPAWTQTYGSVRLFARKSAVWPPLNLAYLAAIAEQQGHRVIIIDGEAEGISSEMLVKRTVEFNPDLIGITATTPFYHVAIDVAARLKRQLKVPIVLGGPHITVLKENVFDQNIDVAFIGEADASWAKYLECLEKGHSLSQVKGLLYRENGRVVDTGFPELIQNIESIPPPARHLLNNKLYSMGTLEGEKRFTTIMTIRGCPYQCIFCSTKVFGSGMRKNAPAKVMDEIRNVVREYDVKHFVFLDDTMTLYRQHMLDICELMIKENLGITFEGSTRANLVDEEIIRVMRRAGLIRLSFGLESVDENIRKTMKKMVPLESYETANRLSNKYGIETLNSCMIGLPGETLDTVRSTLAFLRRSKEIKQANISIAVPYPGTELYEMAKRGDHGLKLETEDFSRYQRYNAAVLTVGDFSPADLIDIQNEAFASIYLAPWRWPTVIKRWGIPGFLMTFVRLIKAVMKGKTRFITNKQLGIDE